MKRTVILAVGSELLNPLFRDTNSLFLTERMNDLGLEVASRTVVGDDGETLVSHVRSALGSADVVIAAGGLGPTEDDRTREAFAEALGRKLVFDRRSWGKIEGRFARRGLPVPSSNRKQAFLLQGAVPLDNELGTAPGQWLEYEDRAVLLLPGPPHELEAMFQAHARPRLQAFGAGFRSRRILKITGLTESRVEDLISGLYPPGARLGTRDQSTSRRDRASSDLCLGQESRGSGFPARRLGAGPARPAG